MVGPCYLRLVYEMAPSSLRCILLIWPWVAYLAHVQAHLTSSSSPPTDSHRHLRTGVSEDMWNIYLCQWCWVYAVPFRPRERWNGHHSIFNDQKKKINSLIQNEDHYVFKIVIPHKFSFLLAKNVGVVNGAVPHMHTQQTYTQDMCRMYIKSCYILTK